MVIKWRTVTVAQTFNPGSNSRQVSRLRLVNTRTDAESVEMHGYDDQENWAGPATLTLAAGESRTLSALDLETGNARDLTEAIETAYPQTLVQTRVVHLIRNSIQTRSVLQA